MSLSAKYRIYVTNALSKGSSIQLDRDTAHRFSKVLRCRIDDQVILFNGNVSCVCKILSLGKEVNVEIISYLDLKTESNLKIHMCQALIKNDKFDYVLQKAVELGVTQITPIITEHTIAKLDPQKISTKMLHWQKIIIHATEQAKRFIIPQLNPPSYFTDLIKNSPTEYTNLLLHNHPAGIKSSQITQDNNFVIVIGPEGGFSNQEVNHAIQHKFSLVELGPRTLRTETCALASICVLQTLYGDF